MLVTATEFKNNIGKYFALVAEQDIFIIKNGKNVAKLSGVKQNKVDIAKSLFGIIQNDGTTLNHVKNERLARYEVIN